MTPVRKDEKWESFWRWALGMALTALIAMQGVLYGQIVSKIDRVTNLMLAERDRIYKVMDAICQKISEHDGQIARQHEAIENLKEKHRGKEQ